MCSFMVCKMSSQQKIKALCSCFFCFLPFSIIVIVPFRYEFVMYTNAAYGTGPMARSSSSFNNVIQFLTDSD